MNDSPKDKRLQFVDKVCDISTDSILKEVEQAQLAHGIVKKPWEQLTKDAVMAAEGKSIADDILN